MRNRRKGRGGMSWTTEQAGDIGGGVASSASSQPFHSLHLYSD